MRESSTVPAATKPVHASWSAMDVSGSRARLSGWVRLGFAAGTLGLIAAWVMASRLTPAGSGLGTHQQLGLPPCSLRVWLNVRCPACGMTTSWAHLADGQWVQAVAANGAGTLLGLMTIISLPYLAWSAWTGAVPSLRMQWAWAVGLVVAVTIAIVEWLVRLNH